MFRKALENLSAEDVRELVAARVPELQDLEFKRDLPGSSDRDKFELCGDVSAMANSAGGHICFGVAEEAGKASSISGVSSPDVHGQITRLEGILKSGIEPRIGGIRLTAIDMGAGKTVVVVRVPRSWNGPHFTRSGDNYRMYFRGANARVLASVDQMRTAFRDGEMAFERMRSWVARRLELLRTGQGPARLQEGPFVVLHSIPVAPREALDIQQIDRLCRELQLLESGSIHERINLDGKLFARGGMTMRHSVWSVTQAFRTGSIEHAHVLHAGMVNGRRAINIRAVEQSIISRVERHGSLLRSIGESSPLAVFVRLSGVADMTVAIEDAEDFVDWVFDRDPVMLPEVVIDSLDRPVAEQLRPLCDSMWNAVGLPRSTSFNADGKYLQRQS